MSGGEGKRFEKNIKDSCDKQGILWERYQDSNKFGFGKETRFTMQSPCDGHIYYEGKLYYIELKSCKTGSISIQKDKTEKNKSIKAHQIESLIKRSQYDGVIPGFIIWFVDRDTKTKHIEGGTYFIHIKDFVDWLGNCGKSSINQEDAKSIGTEVHGRKLKTNYRYNIEDLLGKI